MKKIAVLILSSLMISGCEGGKLDTQKTPGATHISDNYDYKKRPGWDALMRIAIDDCDVHKNGGKSTFSWEGFTCDDRGIIRAVNSNSQAIPLFYAAYHEYGSRRVGTLSGFENNSKNGQEIYKLLANLADALKEPSKVNAIYADFKNDRQSMDLNEVSESTFKGTLASLSKDSDKFAAEYQNIHDGKKFNNSEKDNELTKHKPENYLNSEKEIDLVLWRNPTPSQQLVIDALQTVRFTIRNDGIAYANGRRFMPVSGLSSLQNSLDMSMESCSEVGAYVGEKKVSTSCIQGFANSIKEWGAVAKDRSISERAWNSAAMNASIAYNPVKWEILFSHWAGLARLYSSRGY